MQIEILDKLPRECYSHFITEVHRNCFVLV